MKGSVCRLVSSNSSLHPISYTLALFPPSASASSFITFVSPSFVSPYCPTDGGDGHRCHILRQPAHRPGAHQGVQQVQREDTGKGGQQGVHIPSTQGGLLNRSSLEGEPPLPPSLLCLLFSAPVVPSLKKGAPSTSIPPCHVHI